MASLANIVIVSVLYCATGFLSNNELVAQFYDYNKLTFFTREKAWESAGGNTKTGKLVSLGLDDEVEILETGKSEPIKLLLGQLCKKDQEFIARFRDKALKSTFADSRKLSTAEEVRDLYQKLFFDGLVPPDNKKNFQNLLEVLNRHAASDCISIPGEFIKPKELAARKKEANQLIDDWISESNEDHSRLKRGETLETKTLKAAIRKDPTSVEGILLLSLLYGIKEGGLEAEERRLVDAIETARRYHGLANETEKYNMAGAFNNLAVNCCRQNLLNKALRHWTEAAAIADGEIKEIIGENLVRVTRLAQNDSKLNTGLSASKQELRRAEELFKTFNPKSSTGGWKLVVPKGADGQVRSNIPFVLAPKTTFEGEVIGDTRCLKCFGSGQTRCPNPTCTRGAVPEEYTIDKYITYPNGTKQYAGKGVAVRKVRCPTCFGDSEVKCPCCTGSGTQK